MTPPSADDLMRAIQITRLDGPAGVEHVEVPSPVPTPDEVLIEVHAAGVTFPDVLLTRGMYQLKPDLPFVPGYEVAGIVRSAPEGSGLAPGDRVAALPIFGGYAELLAVDPKLVFPLPDSVSFEAGAGMPMNLLTVDYALVRRGGLRAGETVLVQGAAGGIGTAATQLARALGARVIAVVSTEEKAQIARSAGAHDVVFADGFLHSVQELTEGLGVDLVVDPVGGDRFDDSVRCLRPEGRLLILGFTGGTIPTLKASRALNRDIDVRGAAFGRVWWREQEYLGEQWTRLLPHIEDGSLRTIVGATYPLEQAATALSDMEQRRAVGKLVLLPR